MKVTSFQRSAVGLILCCAGAAWLLIVVLIAQDLRAQSTNGVSLAASGLVAPEGLTLGPHNRLFAVDANDGAIYHLGVGGRLNLEASGFKTPRDVVFDRSGNMYVADSGANTVYRLDKQGNTVVLAENMLGPCCLGFDGDGNLLVAHQLPEATAAGTTAPQYNGAVTRISSDGQQALVASGFMSPQGLLIGKDGNIIIAAEGYQNSRGGDVSFATGSGLYRIDELGQVTRILDSGSITPSRLALSPQGTLFFSGVNSDEGAVFVTEDGTLEPFVNGLLLPRGLATDGRNLYVADEAAGKVWRVPFDQTAGNAKSANASPETGDGTIGITSDVPPGSSQSGGRKEAQPSRQDGSTWGYIGTPDYSQIPFTPEGEPRAPAGVTCMIGRILRTDDVPLRGVTVRWGKKAIRTNSQGYWMLKYLGAGQQVYMIDGRSADEGDTHYPIAMVAWEIYLNRPNVLPFTNYLPIVDTAHTTQIQGHRETIHTTPLIPGLEVHIEPGTKITSVDGTPVTEITTTLVPFDKPMYPMSLLQDFGNHITIQPGGAMCSKPIKVVYNNPSKFPAGTHVQLWEYDPMGHAGWFNYGLGTVTKDTQQIVPDNGVGFTRFGCGFASRSPPPSSDDPPPPHKPDCTRDPVRVGTGVFWQRATDLMVPGLMPIALQRTYRNQDANQYEFGIGTLHSYDYRLWGYASGIPNSGWIDFTTPSDTSYRFVCQTNAPVIVYICTNDFRFAGAKIYQIQTSVYPTVNGLNYFAVMKDGTRYDFDGKGYLRAIRDPNNNILTVDRGSTAAGNVQRIVQPSGRYILFQYTQSQCNNQNLVSQVSDNAGRSVGYVYDGSCRLIAVTNVVGGVTRMAYDANNNLLTNVLPNSVTNVINFYDSANRVTNQIAADGGVTSISYTTNATSGLITRAAVTQPSGATFTNDYNSTSFVTNHVDAFGGTQKYILDASTSAVNDNVDELSRTNVYVYDANFNVVAITNTQGKVTKFSYEPNFNRLTTVIDPLGRTNSFGYDGQGNLAGITNALGKVTTITYNAQGLPLTVTDPLTNTYTFAYNESFDLASVKDPLGNEVKRIVDSLGRPVALIDAFGRTTKITYSDVMGSCMSCGGGAAADLPASITDPISGTTMFGYDSIGNLTNVTDALTHGVNYGYDVMNRLTSRTDQLSNIERYFYDKNGNVTNFVDRRNISIAFKYDALDRRTGVVYAANDSVRYIYDPVGRVSNVVDSIAGTIKLTYDSLDRLTQENNNNGTVSYAYNDVGLRTNMTVTGQNTAFYRYDNANRLTNVVQGTFTSSLFYDDAGRRTKLILPNGINVLYSYDTASRLTNITYQAAVTNKIDYAYDQTGNRVSQLSALATYFLPLAVTNSTYDAANHQTLFGSYTIQYDLNGNVTNIISGTTTNKLLWSARNQLTNMLGAVTGSFAYDGLGRRKQRTVTGTTENYLYDGLDIIQQLDNTGTVAVNYFRGLAIDEPWLRDEVYAGKHGSTFTNWVYMADALGSIVALTDSSKVISNQYDYEPFGATTNSGASNKNSYKFTAREDDGTGLYSYRFRFYHPALGRFMSEDPIENAGGHINLYVYVADEPIRRSDPGGLRLQVCLTPTAGGFLTHKYFFWDTAPPGFRKRCERQDISPGMQNNTDTGRPIGEGDVCKDVDDTFAAAIMLCCQTTAHNRPWVPFATDCHNIVDDCLTKYGVTLPDLGQHPRLGGLRKGHEDKCTGPTTCNFGP